MPELTATVAVVVAALWCLFVLLVLALFIGGANTHQRRTR